MLRIVHYESNTATDLSLLRDETAISHLAWVYLQSRVNAGLSSS
jgi:hypothetical protein